MEIIDTFLVGGGGDKTFIVAFRSKIFQTLYDHNLAQDLCFSCRVDDLDFVSRSQMCQNYKVQIVLFIFWPIFLSSVV